MAGDIFVFRPAGHPFYFGRVIRTDATISGVIPANLIYLYRATSIERAVIPPLWPSELLVPPLFTNGLPWRRGYFETVGHAPLTRWDVLRIHTFLRLLPTAVGVTKQFVNEYGERVGDPGYAVGPYGLGSFRTIDDDVSAALGIPLVADDPRPRKGGVAAPTGP